MSDARRSAASAPALARVVDCVFIWPGYLAGALYFVLAFFVTYDVLARKWGAAVGLPTTRVTDEISGYLLALAATWGFAFALRTGGHVRVDVMFPYLARRLRTAADVLAQLLMAAFAGLVAWKIWALVQDSLESDARSSTYLLTPLWVPQGILGIGFSLLALAAVFGAIAILAGWESGAGPSAGPQA
jgi:TRAP-type mannitol/chloroaromatic compound transport system permease small subunit